MTADEGHPGLLLHLAGPLQSYGEHSRFSERDTVRFPTRSAVIGLIAAAMGRDRAEAPDDLRRLRIAVRVDRPGTILRDFHTVGGGQSNKLTVMTAEGKPRPGDTATLVSHRYYLQDAAFTVAVSHESAEHDDRELLEHCRRALLDPRWPPYLGRRSCPPAGPLLLGTSANPWRDLVGLPLHDDAARLQRDRGRIAGRVRIVFYADQPLDALPVPPDYAADGRQSTSTINDEPVSYQTLDRRYLGRTLYSRALLMPAAKLGGLGARYIESLREHFANTPGEENRR